jgi:hypothetical protein
MIRQEWTSWPWHVPLLVAYPILALLAYNITQVKFQAAGRALLVALAGICLLWLALGAVLRNLSRAGLLCSLYSLLFFSYGHVYNLLEMQPGWLAALGRHRVLAPLWVILAAAGSGWLLRRLKDTARFTRSLNAIAVVMAALPLAQLAWYQGQSMQVQEHPDDLPAEFSALNLPPDQPPPDVYYIILDGYARGDVLIHTMGFDNTPFLSELQRLGFYLAACSQSNYAQTELSLASSLNSLYLDSLVPIDPESQDRLPLRPWLRKNLARLALERLGYTFVAFETGYLFSQFEDADVYYSSLTRQVGGMSGFELLLVKTSAGLLLADSAKTLPRFLRLDQAAPANLRREQILYTLDTLDDVPQSVPSPKFVFAHVVAPHTPIVLGAGGEAVFYEKPTDPESYFQAYTNEVRYLNQRVLQVVERILADSPTPPVIIIQADHGHDLASAEERMAILNAYYLPDGGQAELYPGISPVNTFRLVFNRYFSGQLALLPDQSYFSNYVAPFEFMQLDASGTDCP